MFGFGSLEGAIDKDTSLESNITSFERIEQIYQGKNMKAAMKKAVELQMSSHAAKLERHLQQKTEAQLRSALSIVDGIEKGIIPPKNGLELMKGCIGQVKTEAQEIEALAMQRKALTKGRRRQTKRQRKRTKAIKKVGKAEQKSEDKIIKHQQKEEQVPELQQPAAAAERAEETSKRLESQELAIESQEINVANAEINLEKNEIKKIEEEEKAVKDAVKEAERIQKAIKEEEERIKRGEEEAKKIIQKTIAQVEQQVNKGAQSPQNLHPSSTNLSAPPPNSNGRDPYGRDFVKTYGERGMYLDQRTITINGRVVSNNYNYVGKGLIEDLKKGIIPKQIRQVIVLKACEEISKVGLNISPQYVQKMMNANTAKELFDIVDYIYKQVEWGDVQKLKQEIYGLVKDEEAIARMEQEEQTMESQERQEEHVANQLGATEDTLQSNKEQAGAQAAQAIGAEAQAGYMNKDIQKAAAMYAMLEKDSEKSQKMAELLRKADILMEMNK